MIPLLMYGLWHYIPSTPWPCWLTDCAFPIFLLHRLFYVYITIACKRFPLIGALPLGEQLMKLIIGLFGAVLLTIMIRRFSPRFAGVLFGGR